MLVEWKQWCAEVAGVGADAPGGGAGAPGAVAGCGPGAGSGKGAGEAGVCCACDTHNLFACVLCACS